MTSVNVTELKNTVTVNEGDATVVTVTTAGPQGTFVDGDLGDVTVSSNGANIVVNAGAIDNANIASNAAIALSKLATGALPTAITVTSANISDLSIVDADISGSAAISLSKLATGALPTAITVTSANISDLSIVNADINASAAIAGTKISPDFGSQNIVTTGTLSSDNITISNTHPKLFFTDTNNNPDYLIHNENGVLKFKDTTNNQGILRLNAQHTDFITNVDFLAGIDVTGDISCTGSIDGRDVAADGTKLDGIETGATADQTAAEIKTLLDSNGIVNSNVDASAAIAGTKISPNFGSQNITTTGTGSTLGRLNISDVNPYITLTDTNNDSDFSIRGTAGNFMIRDDTNSAPRITINSSGTVDVAGNLRLS